MGDNSNNNMHVGTLVVHRSQSTSDLRLRTLNSQQVGGVYNHLFLTAEVQQMKSFSCVCFKSGSLSDVDS